MIETMRSGRSEAQERAVKGHAGYGAGRQKNYQFFCNPRGGMGVEKPTRKDKRSIDR